MNVQIEALFTSALGLQAPWVVRDVRLDTVKHRIDFDVECKQPLLACPACGAPSQKVHDRLPRSWRHLDFFQYEAWLHAQVPRVGCAACGKTTQIGVPWEREASGFTLLFEALALTMCKDLPVRQAARATSRPRSAAPSCGACAGIRRGGPARRLKRCTGCNAPTSRPHAPGG